MFIPVELITYLTSSIDKSKKMQDLRVNNTVCSCGVCLDSYCSSSDSKLTIGKCWCAECKDTRKDAKLNAYKITILKGAI